MRRASLSSVLRDVALQVPAERALGGHSRTATVSTRTSSVPATSRVAKLTGREPPARFP